MKMIKDKKLVVGADFAGFPLKEAVCAHLRAKGWEITDMGVKADSDPNDTDLMFHRVGLRVGAMISEGEFERVSFGGREMYGRAYLEYINDAVRTAYFSGHDADSPETDFFMVTEHLSSICLKSFGSIFLPEFFDNE